MNTNEPGDETGSILKKKKKRKKRNTSTNINHSHHVSKRGCEGGRKWKPREEDEVCFIYPLRPLFKQAGEEGGLRVKCTVITKLELRNCHGHSLGVAVADADVDRLDASFLGSSSGGTVKLKSKLALLIPRLEKYSHVKYLR